MLVTSCATHLKSNDGEEIFINDSDFLKRKKYNVQKKETKVIKRKKTDTKLQSKKSSIKKQTVKKKTSKTIAKKSKEQSNDLINNRPNDLINNQSNDLKSFFPEGEKVVLSMIYFGVEAGRIHIGIKSDKLVNGEEALHFYALGKTSSFFSLIYKIKDRIESLWSLKFKRPLTLAFDVNETKQKYKTRSYFDWDKKRVDYFEEGWHKKKGKYQNQKTWELPTKAQDIVSVLFYLRTLPLKVGETYTFDIMENQKLIKTHLKVDRREVIVTNIGKRSALLLKPSFTTKGKFKKIGDISIWVTDDKYRQILRIESKIKLGTIIAKIERLIRP